MDQEHAQLIYRYAVEGVTYLEINDFDKHQGGLHKRTESHFPEFPGISRNPREKLSTPPDGGSVKFSSLKEEEKSEKGKSEKRGSRRAPVDFVLSAELIEFGVGLGLSRGGVAFELAKFRDYEFARPRSDWDATFRNWLRTEAQRQNGGDAGAMPVATHPIRRLV